MQDLSNSASRLLAASILTSLSAYPPPPVHHRPQGRHPEEKAGLSRATSNVASTEQVLKRLSGSRETDHPWSHPSPPHASLLCSAPLRRSAQSCPDLSRPRATGQVTSRVLQTHSDPSDLVTTHSTFSLENPLSVDKTRIERRTRPLNLLPLPADQLPRDLIPVHDYCEALTKRSHVCLADATHPVGQAPSRGGLVPLARRRSTRR